MHRSLMRLPHPHTVPAVNLPPAQHTVTPSTDKPLSTRAPGHRKCHSGMLPQGVHPLPAVRLPHEEFPTLSATTSRGQLSPIGAPGHVHDSPTVSSQSSQQRAIRGVPHIHVAIIASTHQLRSIGVPGHITNEGRLRLPNPAAGARCHVPHLHSM